MSAVSGVLLAVLLATAPQAAADVELQAEEIESALIAPCCFRQQVSVHSSPAADDVRRDVRARLRAGQTRAQILDAYVAHYGKRILAEPPAEGWGAALQVAPFLIALAGLALLILIVRNLIAHNTLAIATPTRPVTFTADDQAHLDEALRDLD